MFGVEAGFVDAAEGVEEADGGVGWPFHVGAEGGGLVVDLQRAFVAAGVFVEGAELAEGFYGGDGEGPAVVLIEPVVFKALGEEAAA